MRLFLIYWCCSRLLLISLLQKYACSRFPCFRKSPVGVCGHVVLILLWGWLSWAFTCWTIFTLPFYASSTSILFLDNLRSYILWRGADCTCFHNLSDFVAVCCLSRLVQNYACSRFLVSVYLMLALGVILFWFLASLTTSFSCWGYFSSMTLCFWSHYACPLAVVQLTASFCSWWWCWSVHSCHVDRRTILPLPFMCCPLFLALVCELYPAIIDSAAECCGVAPIALTVSAITLLGCRGWWCSSIW